MSDKKTAIITGASGGIGGGLVEGFVREGYNVVGTSREASRTLTTSASLVLVDGDIGKQKTADDAVDAAVRNFGTIDVLVNNAGIFLKKPFTDFTTEDFNALVSTNLFGFFYITQRTVKEMLKQKSGYVVSITAALADRPIAGVNGSISMITKGGLNAATMSLAIEYAKDGIRFKRRGPRRCGYGNAAQCSLRLGVAAQYENGEHKGYCRRRSLLGKCQSGEWRDPPHRWRRSASPLVIN